MSNCVEDETLLLRFNYISFLDSARLVKLCFVIIGLLIIGIIVVPCALVLPDNGKFSSSLLQITLNLEQLTYVS